MKNRSGAMHDTGDESAKLAFLPAHVLAPESCVRLALVLVTWPQGPSLLARGMWTKIRKHLQSNTNCQGLEPTCEALSQRDC